MKWSEVPAPSRKWLLEHLRAEGQRARELADYSAGTKLWKADEPRFRSRALACAAAVETLEMAAP